MQPKLFDTYGNGTFFGVLKLVEVAGVEPASRTSQITRHSQD